MANVRATHLNKIDYIGWTNSCAGTVRIAKRQTGPQKNSNATHFSLNAEIFTHISEVFVYIDVCVLLIYTLIFIDIFAIFSNARARTHTMDRWISIGRVE